MAKVRLVSKLQIKNLTMFREPKFTWGETVLVDGKKLGSVSAITEFQLGHQYAVEFPDGSEALVSEHRLQTASERNV